MATTSEGPKKPNGEKALSPQAQRRVTLRNVFEQQRPELAKLLPRGMDPDRLFRMALTECIKQPKLLECTAESWALAVQTCAQQGLYPDSGLGFMYLVPRKIKRKGAGPNGSDAWFMEVTAQRGYQGDIRLARNSGEIAAIWAEVVYEKDAYRVTKGLNPDISHEPTDGEPGALRACYAVAKLTSGEVVFVTLTKRDVDRHKASSESADESWSPWVKHTAAMWRKTAIHELYKWLPKSTERSETVARQIMGDVPIDTTAIEVASVPMAPATGLEGLTARLADETPETPAATCSHPDVPPSAVAKLKDGETVTCKACGEAISNPEAKPAQKKIGE